MISHEGFHNFGHELTVYTMTPRPWAGCADTDNKPGRRVGAHSKLESSIVPIRVQSGWMKDSTVRVVCSVGPSARMQAVLVGCQVMTFLFWQKP